MDAGLVTAAGVVAAAIPAAYVTYRLGLARNNVDQREAGVEERRVNIEERQFDAALRDELRASNVVLTQQVANLTSDNALVHKNLHRLGNEMMLMQGNMIDLTADRAQCRRELAEVLLAVNALEHGRERMTERLDNLEGGDT